MARRESKMRWMLYMAGDAVLTYSEEHNGQASRGSPSQKAPVLTRILKSSFSACAAERIFIFFPHLGSCQPLGLDRYAA